MTLMVPVAMFGWIPVVLLMFSILPARRAVIAAYVGAWLFLPVYAYSFPLIPSYNKTAAATVAVLLGTLIFDPRRLFAFRFRKIDLIVLVFTVAPLLSSLANGLGLWDGLSEMLRSLLTWGAVYFVGRLYIDSPQAMRELAMGIVIGGLIYVPLCLWEVRMSPQLNRIVYGFYQQSFAQTHRGGGFRPSVFMQHGLMVADWMMASTIAAFWLWISGAVKRLWLVPMWACFIALAGTLVLCKSTGAIALMLVGVAALTVIRFQRTTLPLLVLAAVPVVYIALSTEGMVPYDTMTSLAAELTSEQRVGSLEHRFQSERKLVDRATDSLLFGWGGQDRWTYNSRGQKIVWGADQLWVITFGKTGLVGLGALVAMLSVPAFVCWRRLPRRAWTLPLTAPTVGLAMIVVLFHIDCLFNAMLNPVYVLIIGGATSLPVMRLVSAAPAAAGPASTPAGAAGADRPPPVGRSPNPA